MSAQPSRRSVLRLGGLGAAGAFVLGPGLAACTASSSSGTPPPPPTPDELARVSAARRETQLAERASRTAVRHPDLTVAATAAVAHTAHAKALNETLVPSPAPSGSASGSGSAVPSSQAEAARELAAAEAAAAEAHRTALAATGVTGDLARLLASVAASDGSFGAAIRAESASS
jgi:hypothetical protein